MSRAETREPDYDPRLHGTGVWRAARAFLYRRGPLLRAIKSRPAQRVVYGLRGARLVQQPIRFALAEIGARGTREYRLRDGAQTLSIRHCTDDVVMLHQVIGRDLYEPPAEAVLRLSEMPTPPRVVDLGAHIGLFSLQLLQRFPAAKITAVEADPENARLLARNVQINGLEGQVEVVQAAAGREAGEVRFSGGGSIHSKVVAASVDNGALVAKRIDAFPLLERSDLVKIDIEGSEWEILLDERFRLLRALVITLEWHASDCPEPDPAATAESALCAAGYEVQHDFVSGDCGTLWAWR